MSLHYEIASELRERIDSGEYPIGSRMPSEAELCREFGTSRGPVRQAVDVLRQEGLLSVRQGRRPVVLSPGSTQPFESLTSFTEWAESVGKTPGQSTISVSRMQAGDEVAAIMGLKQHEHLVEVLRLRTLDGVPTMLECSSFPLNVGALIFSPNFDPDAGSIYRMLIEEGIDLHSGKHTIDAVAADDQDAEFLNIARGAPILRVRRVVTSRDGTVQEYAEDRYLPGVASISIENSRDVAGNVLRFAPLRDAN